MLIFIGGGGHAKVLFDIVTAQNKVLYAYVDPNPQEWLGERNIKRFTDDELATVLPNKPELFMSFLGLDPEALQKRAAMMKDYHAKGAYFNPLIHPTAVVSPKAVLSIGVQIMSLAVVGSGAKIGEGAVVGSGAVVDHEATIGAGAYIAPKAVVLSGAQIGECSYIGSGAVIMQNSGVPPQSFVQPLTVYK